MKPRNWILVLGTGLMLLIVTVTLWLRYADINQDIRRSIVAAVQEAGVTDFSIDRVRLKLNSLELRDVRLVLPQAGIDVQVDRVTALFSLMEYFQSGFDPIHSVPYFIIEQPVVQLSPTETGESATATPWWELLRSTSFIRRFFLVDGTLSYRNDTLATVPWHFSAHFGSPASTERELALNLGPTVDAAAAVKIRTTVNLESSQGSLQLHADSLLLTGDNLPVGFPGVELQHLLTRAHFQLDFDSTGSDLRGQGLLRLQNLTLADQLELPLVSVRFTGQGDSLSLEFNEFSGAPAVVTGQGVISTRGFHFNSQINQLDLGSSRLWLGDSLISGRADLDLSGAGSWSAPRLAVGLTAEELILFEQPPARASLFVTCDNSGVELRQLQVNWPGRELHASGSLFRWGEEWAPKLLWGLGLQLEQPPLSLVAEGVLQRPGNEWQLSGTSAIERDTGVGEATQLRGTVELTEQTLQFSSLDDQVVDYCLLLELTTPPTWQLDLHRAEQLAIYLGLELPPELQSSLSISGDLQRAGGELALQWEGSLLHLLVEIDFAEAFLEGNLHLSGTNPEGLSGKLRCNWSDPEQFLLEELLLDEALLIHGSYSYTAAAGDVRLQSDHWLLDRLQLAGVKWRPLPGFLNADFDLHWEGASLSPQGFIELAETELPALQGNRLRLETAVLQDSIRCHLWSFSDHIPLLESTAVFDRKLDNGQVRLATGKRHPGLIFRVPYFLGGILELELAAQLSEQHWTVSAVTNWDKPSFENYVADQLSFRLHSRPNLAGWYLDTLRLTLAEAKYPLVIAASGALGEPADSLLLSGQGDFLEFISRGSSLLEEAESYCNFELLLRGTLSEPVPVRGFFRTKNARVQPTVLTTRISDLDLDLELAAGKLYIHEMRSKHSTGRLSISNRFDPPQESLELESLQLPGPGIDLGILVISDEVHGMQAVPGVELNLPGLMQEKWSGLFHFTGRQGKGQFYLAGPIDHPLLQGNIELSRTTFTYPFIGEGEGEASDSSGALLDFLWSLRWDVELGVGLSNSYRNDIEGFTDWQFGGFVPDYFKTIHTNIILDPGDRLHLTGTLLDDSFRMTGRVNSSQGTVQLLNKQFTIDEAGLEFDASSLLPVVYGSASMMVADSSGFTKDIHLTLYMLDEEGNRQIRGRWGEMTFDLTDDYGSPQTQILTEMGFGAGLMENTVQDIYGSLVAQAILPYMTRVEQSIQQLFGLDMVQLRTDIVSNYLDTRLFTTTAAGSPEEVAQSGNSETLRLLAGSNFMVGKFITPRMLLSYSGTLFNQYHEDLLANDLQYRQALKVDYRITRNLGMMVEMAYDPVFRYDERIMLRFRQFY